MRTCLFFALLLSVQNLRADITGRWNTEGNESQIEIAYDTATQTYTGTIVSIVDALDQNGAPRRDLENPDTAQRNQPIVGLTIMRGFKKKSDASQKYTGGTVYDPKSGKTYKGLITHPSADTLKLRGYIGTPVIGRTAEWTRVKEEISPAEKIRP